MFDMFGMNKANTREAIEHMAKGVTAGLLEGFEWKLQEKSMEIERLREQVNKLEERLEEVQNGKEQYSRGVSQKRGKQTVGKGDSSKGDGNKET